jgi:hypothetical protein
MNKNKTKAKKNNNTHHKKRAVRVAQVVECLPSKCEALSSNFRTTKKRKKRKSEGTRGQFFTLFSREQRTNGLAFQPKPWKPEDNGKKLECYTQQKVL